MHTKEKYSHGRIPVHTGKTDASANNNLSYERFFHKLHGICVKKHLFPDSILTTGPTESNTEAIMKTFFKMWIFIIDSASEDEIVASLLQNK